MIEPLSCTIDIGTTYIEHKSNSSQECLSISHSITTIVPTEKIKIGDIYIHGRALSGMWCVGALEACRQLQEIGKLSIGTVHGYSFGAVVAVCFVCEIPISKAVMLYRTLHKLIGKRSQEIVSIGTTLLRSLLPNDAYLMCQNKVYIGYTDTFPLMQYREKTIFSSNEELLLYISYSMTIPGVTVPIRGPSYSRYIDGGIGNAIWGWCKRSVYVPPYEFLPFSLLDLTPKSCISESTLDVELVSPWMFYSYLFEASDPHIDLLIVRGTIDMFRFLASGVDSHHIKKK
jgi:hypothetical protein